MRNRNVLRGALMLLVVLVAGVVLAPGEARAQRLLDLSPLDGVYRHDRWGVAWFGGFLVDPALNEALAVFEGVPVSLEVVAAHQPNRPGQAMITAIGAIKPLPVWPLDVDVRFVPDAIDAKDPFQLVVEMRNRTDEPVTFISATLFEAGQAISTIVEVPASAE